MFQMTNCHCQWDGPLASPCAVGDILSIIIPRRHTGLIHSKKRDYPQGGRRSTLRNLARITSSESKLCKVCAFLDLRPFILQPHYERSSVPAPLRTSLFGELSLLPSGSPNPHRLPPAKRTSSAKSISSRRDPRVASCVLQG